MLLETTEDYRNNTKGNIKEIAVSILQRKSANHVVIYDKCTAFLVVIPIIAKGTIYNEYKLILQILSKFLVQYDIEFTAISSSNKKRQIAKCLTTFCRQNNILHKQHTTDEETLEILMLRAIKYLFNEYKDEQFEIQMALSAFRKHGSITPKNNDNDSVRHTENETVFNTRAQDFANASNNTKMKRKTAVESEEHKRKSRPDKESAPEMLRPANLETNNSKRKNKTPQQNQKPVESESLFKLGREKYRLKNREMQEEYEQEKNEHTRLDTKGYKITTDKCCCCCGKTTCKPPNTCPAVAGTVSRICTNSNRQLLRGKRQE